MLGLIIKIENKRNPRKEIDLYRPREGRFLLDRPPLETESRAISNIYEGYL